MATSIMVSTLVMGGFLLAVVVGIMRLREWRQGRPREKRSMLETAADTSQREDVWLWTYVLLAVLMAGVTYAYVGAISPTAQQVALVVGGGTFGLALLAFFCYGMYQAVRARGRASAQAVGVSVTLLGFLFVLAVAGKLVMAG